MIGASSSGALTVACDTLDDEQIAAASDLIANAGGELYRRFGLPHPRLLEMLAEQLRSEEPSEIKDSVALLDDDGTIAAVVSAYPASEQEDRQVAGLFHIVSALDDAEPILTAVGHPANTLPSIPADSFYLARIAVAPKYIGTGLGSQALAVFENKGRTFPSLSLHVADDNRRAQAFYRKHGFTAGTSLAGGYLCMSRPTHGRATGAVDKTTP